MNKLFQFFAALVLLTSCQFAHAAAPNRHVKHPTPTPADSSHVRSKFILHPVGGEMIAMITVSDANNHPVQGATVSAPCTGLANKLTDVHGVAVFDMGTVCTCSENTCTVTTPHGCSQAIKISCGTYPVTCNQ